MTKKIQWLQREKVKMTSKLHKALLSETVEQFTKFTGRHCTKYTTSQNCWQIQRRHTEIPKHGRTGMMENPWYDGIFVSVYSKIHVLSDD